MKFANYTFRARGLNNLGDHIQIIAIDIIYRQMGLRDEDIVYIDKNDLGKYCGEYVILPVTMPLVDYTEGGISGRFSDHIIPLFLGLTLVHDNLLPEEVAYYHRYEPIGCRDERTMLTLRKFGVQAYLHGCITATLPLRETIGRQFDKVFIVDVPDELLAHIPEELKKSAEYRTHLHEDLQEDPKKMMQRYYDDYKNEAKLVITSLLHCSVPCMAAGIPVILAKSEISYRFAWLEKLLPLYDLDSFDKIDWYPQPVNYEPHKARLLDITISRLWDVYKRYQPLYDLSWFYEHRDKSSYIVDSFKSLQQFIDTRFTDRNENFRYAIWGLSQTSTLTVSYISKRYPNATLTHVYDSFRQISFEGLTSESPENIRTRPEELVFVTAIGAQSMAEKLFSEIGKKKDSYAFLKVVI